MLWNSLSLPFLKMNRKETRKTSATTHTLSETRVQINIEMSRFFSSTFDKEKKNQAPINQMDFRQIFFLILIDEIRLDNILPVKIIVEQQNRLQNVFYHDETIRIREENLFQFDQKKNLWKQIYVREKFSPFFHDLTKTTTNERFLVISNGSFYQIDFFNRSNEKIDVIEKMSRFSPENSLRSIDFHRLKFVFSTNFPSLIFLVDQNENVVLFSFETSTIVYEFDSFVSNSNSTIVHLALSSSSNELLIVVFRHFRAEFLHFFLFDERFSSDKIQIDSFDEKFFVRPSSKLDAFFLFDQKKMFYTPNFGYSIVEVFSTNDTDESILPSFDRKICSSTSFSPLFDTKEVFQIEKNEKKTFEFRLETIFFISFLLISTPANRFVYSMNLTENLLDVNQRNVFIEISIKNDVFQHQSASFRIDLIDKKFSCRSSPSFRIETKCSSLNKFRVKK